MTQSNNLPNYEVYAIRYAHLAQRQRKDNFIASDDHDGAMPMDFFVWLIRSPQRTVLVDTGFGERAAQQRQRQLLKCPIESLQALGVSAQSIEYVILTHLHYDHAGNLDKLPNAKFHIQESEVHYACGHHMCHGVFRHAYDVEDVVTLVRKVYADRVVFHQSDTVLAPGIELALIGGHTQGLQSVRVHTARGWVVLASDASHYYDNLRNRSPFPIVYHVGEMVDGYTKLQKLADSPDHIVPGHDPLVLLNYPRHDSDNINIVKLHEPPVY